MRFLLAAILLIPAFASSETVIGKIVRSDGLVKKININCRGTGCGSKSRNITPGERIKTANKSSARVLLKDGTAIIIHGNSDLIVTRVRLRDRDRPTELYLEKGKIQVIQKNSFLDTSLIIKTPVSITKSVNSEINIVTAKDETAVFVYSGEAGFAGTTPSKDKAFILTGGDESSVKRDESPVSPVKVKITLRTSWLGRHIISEDARRILVYKNEGLPADWPFIKND
ncbi:MAG TPA: FecR domain-containing protein [Spirochaetota bacterium]|nr:FecR domain-containing protein [Spirochaetota bacterium]HPF05947.1 FecR domain-containing protein [Spirochaetota bacterium]HPJ42449.1 FecR domain-containing protein [Spirochaetota bacterium]HPR37221.1 FecR domain-containing protein [Spirochaetota bacterium]HRX46425.1 FecR domain-containing protein [Spirochaetota bacterium]